MDTNEFIRRAKEKHGNEYDYSKTKYINCRSNVIIICRFHGQFNQLATHHINRGSRCRKCANDSKRKSLKKFLSDAKLIHSNKYNYSCVDYKNKKTKVKIICKEHGAFFQLPGSHLVGTQCAKCTNNNKHSTEDWIKLAKKIHGKRYDYSKVVYVNGKTDVIITCKIHGDFSQTPSHHVNDKTNCPKCVNHHNYSTEEWIEKANIKHDYKYDYSKVKYIDSKSKVIISCKKHGDFEQRAQDHLFRSGCPKCFKSYSHASIKWLDFIADKENIFIQHAKNKDEFKIPNSKYKADGFCKATNTIYEFNGCLYHGCPICYDKNSISKISKKPNSYMHEKTLKKEKFIKSQGYNLVSMWEHDWNQIKNDHDIFCVSNKDIELVDDQDIY
jgi:hypothetical protein